LVGEGSGEQTGKKRAKHFLRVLLEW
jgi:hypothetical protein